MDKFQPRYLTHQERKKRILSGEATDFKSVVFSISETAVFEKLVRERSSKRIFNGEKIEGIELSFIKNAIINTPSSCNRQATQVMIVNDETKKAELQELLVGGAGWIGKADTILLLMADMEAYKSPAEVDFMPYLDAGFIGMSVYYAAEAINLGCCFVNPNVREENKERFSKAFNEKGYRFCGAIALGHYNKRPMRIKKSEEIFL